MAPPEYDAFGNPIGEAGSTASLPEPESAPPPRPRRPERPTAPRPRTWVAPVFTILALVALGLMLWSAERDALDSPEVVAREVDGHALAERSMLRAANLRRALRAVQARLRRGEEVTNLRLEPEGLRVDARDDRGRARALTVDVTFGVDARDAGTDTSTDAFGLDIVDPGAVERIVRQTLRQAKAGDENVSYLSLSTGTPPTWTIGLEDVRIADRTWTADLQGLAVTHPGERPYAAGITGPSLIRPDNLARALELVRREGTRMVDLRLAADRLDTTVRRDGGTRSVDVDAALRVMTRDSPAAGSRGSIRVADVPPDGLLRALRRIQAQTGVPASRIDYAVISPPPPGIDLPTRWTIFYANVRDADRAWTATLDGRKVKPL